MRKEYLEEGNIIIVSDAKQGHGNVFCTASLLLLGQLHRLAKQFSLTLCNLVRSVSRCCFRFTNTEDVVWSSSPILKPSNSYRPQFVQSLN